MGLFDVNMPLLYGEGSKSFFRLQEQIIRHSDDESIFAWAPVLYTHPSSGFLATSPRDFVGSGDIVESLADTPLVPFSLTNRGLHMLRPLFEYQHQREACHLLLLNCRREANTHKICVFVTEFF